MAGRGVAAAERPLPLLPRPLRPDQVVQRWFVGVRPEVAPTRRYRARVAPEPARLTPGQQAVQAPADRVRASERADRRRRRLVFGGAGAVVVVLAAALVAVQGTGGAACRRSSRPESAPGHPMCSRARWPARTRPPSVA